MARDRWGESPMKVDLVTTLRVPESRFASLVRVISKEARVYQHLDRKDGTRSLRVYTSDTNLANHISQLVKDRYPFDVHTPRGRYIYYRHLPGGQYQKTSLEKKPTELPPWGDQVQLRAEHFALKLITQENEWPIHTAKY